MKWINENMWSFSGLYHFYFNIFLYRLIDEILLSISRNNNEGTAGGNFSEDWYELLNFEILPSPESPMKLSYKKTFFF